MALNDSHDSHDRVLKPIDIARRLDVKVETVWGWLRSGKLCYVALSKRNYRIRESDFEAWLRSATK